MTRTDDSPPVGEGPPLEETTAPAAPRDPLLARARLDVKAFDAGGADRRYAWESDLGRGGMGIVRACRDSHLGRSVAMKLLDEELTPDASALASFLREAKIQAQLEHPAIVPVYDLGRTGERPYLTMKQVRGTTLAEVLARVAARDATAIATFSLHRLLAAFVTVCFAVEYAHARGIIHRDLKPSNVMLGDFGEVYVLDWGIAKVTQSSDAHREDTQAVHLPPLAEDARRGTIAGTHGYMAPEQERGEVEAIDARTDVFALGVVLGEIFAAHAGESAPLELGSVVDKATSPRPEDRYESARALGDAIEDYLSGARDAERKRTLSREHAETAAAVAEADPERAMREVGRSLALDPANRKALETLIAVMSTEPEEVPKTVQEDLQRAVDESIVALTPLSTAAYALILLCLSPLVLWMGVRDWTASTLCFVALIATVLSSLALPRMRTFGPRRLYPVLAASTTAITAATTMFGPFVFVPTLAAVNTLFFVMQLGDRRVLPTVAIGCLPILLGALAPWWGGAASYRFAESGIEIAPWMHRFGAPATPVFLASVSVGMVVLSAFVANHYRIVLATAERRVRIQAWRLSQMLPPAAPSPERRA